MIAVAALALMACGEKNKYDAALDEMETLCDKLAVAMKDGDEKASKAIFDKLNEIAPVVDEISDKGSEEQKARMRDISIKFATTLYGSIDPSTLEGIAEELDENGGEIGDELDDAIEDITSTDD